MPWYFLLYFMIFNFYIVLRTFTDVESHFKRSLGADQYKQIMNNDTKKHEEKKHPQKQKNFHYYQESGG